jgi:SAM-dependent methyltransferase
MSYNAKQEWNKLYTPNMDLSYPAEGVIRILKGTFPGLIMPKPSKGKILDLGCGDGRHFPLFDEMGLSSYGTEINLQTCSILKEKMSSLKVNIQDILEGTTDNLPFQNGFFDYLLTWNSCYYMTASQRLDFEGHVTEMARVIKKDGWLICSVPKKTSFIFQNSFAFEEEGYRVLDKDPWGTRKGEIMRCFNSRDELENEFKEFFTDFCHADLDMEWFGLSYHWHVFVAKRK